MVIHFYFDFKFGWYNTTSFWFSDNNNTETCNNSAYKLHTGRTTESKDSVTADCHSLFYKMSVTIN